MEIDLQMGNRNNKYANIEDFDKLKAIYYGPEISLSDREELHEIAVNRVTLGTGTPSRF